MNGISCEVVGLCTHEITATVEMKDGRDRRTTPFGTVKRITPFSLLDNLAIPWSGRIETMPAAGVALRRQRLELGPLRLVVSR